VAIIYGILQVILLFLFPRKTLWVPTANRQCYLQCLARQGHRVRKTTEATTIGNQPQNLLHEAQST
jgi:hypothetical protein